MINAHRYDFVLSNWVFVWFVLYFVGVIRYSPLLVLLTGLAANTYEFLSTRKGKGIDWEIHYVVRNILIKVLPAYLILRSSDYRIHWKKDLMAAFVFYVVFLTWVHVNGATFSKAANPFNFNTK